jgi:hypothetical protein
MKEHLSLRKQLGPNSPNSTSYTATHTTDTLVVSMPQEMYKDAIYFCREAKNLIAKGSGPFEIWRNLRAAILFGFAAIESCINQFIDSYLNQNSGISDFDYWSERNGYVPIKEKLKGGVELFGGTGKRLSSDTILWRSFTDFKRLRDSLVHYKENDPRFYNTGLILTETEQGILAASEIIKKIYLAHPDNKSYPPTFNIRP